MHWCVCPVRELAGAPRPPPLTSATPQDPGSRTRRQPPATRDQTPRAHPQPLPGGHWTPPSVSYSRPNRGAEGRIDGRRKNYSQEIQVLRRWLTNKLKIELAARRRPLCQRATRLDVAVTGLTSEERKWTRKRKRKQAAENGNGRHGLGGCGVGRGTRARPQKITIETFKANSKWTKV